jgi:hypothetical protein
MRELLKFRNLEERDCATVVGCCRVLPLLPSPRFVPHRVLLGYAVTTGLRNSKEGPRDLRDVMRNDTQHCVFHMSDSSVYNRVRSQPVRNSSENRVTTEKSASLLRASMKLVNAVN